MTVKPVPKMTVSTSYSLPASSTTPFSVRAVSPDATTVTSGRVIAGNQSLDSRIRLHMIRNFGVSFARSSGSATCLSSTDSARRSNSGTSHRRANGRVIPTTYVSFCP